MSYQAGPIIFTSEAEMSAFAERIAPLLRIGDCLLLSGSVGAGKSAFARALIRARLKSPDEDVPSPTFTLVQVYSAEDGDIWHSDLYRLSHVDEVLELGLEGAFDTSINLIEWPDRLGNLTPDKSLFLEFAGGEQQHSITLSSNETCWNSRLLGVIS